jgi:hypothetical protein
VDRAHLHPGGKVESFEVRIAHFDELGDLLAWIAQQGDGRRCPAHQS